MRESRPFLCDDNTLFFDKNSRDFVHPGKWSDPRRDALATSIFALSWQKSSTSAKCDTTLGIASIKNFGQVSGHQRQFVCRSLFASGQSMHQFKDPFLSCQPSRLIFVHAQWTAKFGQQVRCFGHSPLCFWITLEKATRLVFGGQSEPACCHNLLSYRFRCHGKHGFCTNIYLLLQGHLTRQSAKCPPRIVAFIAELLTDP